MGRYPMFLQVTNLVKNYGSMAAVDGVSFSIDEGACFGLLGPNGAGKTTTIEVIEGIRNPNSGKIIYQGRPRDAAFKEHIGIQFQQTSLLSFLSVLKRLKATPLTSFEFLCAQTLSRIFLLMFTLIVVWIGCDLVFSFAVEGSYATLFFVFFLGGISVTSLGLLIAAR